MAKRTQFWRITYLAEKTGNEYFFDGDYGQSKKDAIRSLIARGHKITVLGAKLVEPDPCSVSEPIPCDLWRMAQENRRKLQAALKARMQEKGGEEPCDTKS